jgi:peptidoglycan/xylan/chitin deacetylase (PgdA/CDA1 family)
MKTGLKIVKNRVLCTIYARKHGWRPKIGVRAWRFHGIVDSYLDPSVEHYFNTTKELKDAIEVFKNFDSISLQEIAQILGEKKHAEATQVLVTFDDGYRNNIFACEMLTKAGIRTAVFVCPGHEGGETIWTAEVTLLVLHGGRDSIELLGRLWRLEKAEERAAAAIAIRREMKRLGSESRWAAMRQLRDQFPKERTKELLQYFKSLQLMSWDEIRYLSDMGVEIGSHGCFHEIHNRNQTDVVLEEDVRRSKAIIEHKLRRSCVAFAYPNGDVNSRSQEIVAKAGYKIAFTTKRGIIDGADCPLELPRMKGGRMFATVRDAYYEAERV